jgi:integrase
MGTRERFIKERKHRGIQKEGEREIRDVSRRTINYAVQVVRHVLNLATEWMDEYGLTWLVRASKIKLQPEKDKKRPYPVSWEEQDRFFAELPAYLRQMALFAVNTGCRDQVVCGLRWEWEKPVAELVTCVFTVPKERTGVKNGEDFLVVLNRIAGQVIEEQRGIHPEFVFVNSKGRPVKKMCREAARKGESRAHRGPGP